MKRGRRDVGQRSYDQFFMAHSRATTVQFLGLVILGGSLIAIGASLLLTILSHLSGSPVGFFEGLVLLLVLGICAAFVYFGVMHLRRAFVGRR
jgi:hypothetical protein